MKVALGALALALVGGATAWADWKNVQYYPKDMPSEDLKAAMSVLQRSVGAENCAYCHKVKPQRDMAFDTEKKKTARAMLLMVDKINKNLFTKDALGIKDDDVPKATCFMCHHGKEKPEYKPANADQEKAQAKFVEGTKDPDNAQMVTSMKKLVEKLNKDHFTWKDAPKATCWMCHRGSLEFSTKLPDEDK
jgi:hypothetical protein